MLEVNNLVTLLALAAWTLSTIRWLRVAQREHYLAGSCLRFARRWWALGLNMELFPIACLSVLMSFVNGTSAVVAALIIGIGPRGLALKGRTSKLKWTRRLYTLAIATAGSALTVVGVGAYLGFALQTSAAIALSAPVLVDLGCLLTSPIENALASRFVRRAGARLAEINPTVIAITGSYGKTTTKGYVAHLLRSGFTVLATPVSYNNRAGLARSVNERMVPGTEVFIAEMGTYGKGEISQMCSWVKPAIAVITAIGPVHLERFGSEDRIVEAKSEILEHAHVAVFNIDSPLLEILAKDAQARGLKVLRCSGFNEAADLCVKASERGFGIYKSGRHLGDVKQLSADGEAVPSNVACAIAVAAELGVPMKAMVKHLADLPPADHRLTESKTTAGAVVLDDTFSSNPAGATVALQALQRRSTQRGRRVVVTPGMVELGERQYEENKAFGVKASDVATDVVIVGRTNRKPLLDGVSKGPSLVTIVDRLPQAVSWVRKNLQPGDVVLYENDLPDHYP